MKTIAHIISGNTKVGAISSVKRIVQNYNFKDSNIILISYGSATKIDNSDNNKSFFVDLKFTISYEKFFIQKWNLLYLIQMFIYYFTDIVKLNSFCRKNNVSIIHTHHYIDSFHYCIMRIFGYKCITHVRGVLNKELFFGIPFYIYRSMIYLFSNEIIGISSASLNVLNKKSNKNHIIYNGLEGLSKTINIELENEILGSKVIASVIRFDKNKGIFFLAKTIIEYFNTYSYDNIKFLLIAPIQNENEKICKGRFFELIKSAELIDKVVYFDGFPNYSYFMPYIDILFHPTLEREGFGNVVLEANWFGKPVISTPCLGVNDIIEDEVSGFILSAANTTEAIAQINKLVTNNELYDIFSDNSYKISHQEKFSIKESINQLHEIYRSNF